MFKWVEKVYKVQAILVLDYKKKNDRKIFHSSTKLTTRDSEIDEASKSMHQSIIIKWKNIIVKIILF